MSKLNVLERKGQMHDSNRIEFEAVKKYSSDVSFGRRRPYEAPGGNT